MQVGWIVPGDLSQPTGGYIYDRLIIEHLRGCGDSVMLTEAPDPDVIVGDGLAIPELWGSFERSSAARVLLVHHLTSWELERPDDPALRALEARAILACDGLIATSFASARRVAHEHPDAPECAVVVPGADRLPRRARPARGSAIVLCMVGSLIPRKRVPLVLDALAMIRDANLSLRIIGDPTRNAEHARSISDRIDSRVTLLGVVDDDTLASELSRADALLLASSLEGYGMVLTEALHAGVPLIAARSALSAVDVDLEAVITFDDAPGLAEVLRELPGELDRLQRAAEASRRALPTWREAGEAFRSSLTRVIQRAAEGPARARDS